MHFNKLCLSDQLCKKPIDQSIGISSYSSDHILLLNEILYCTERTDIYFDSLLHYYGHSDALRAISEFHLDSLTIKCQYWSKLSLGF